MFMVSLKAVGILARKRIHWVDYASRRAKLKQTGENYLEGTTQVSIHDVTNYTTKIIKC